ncbi:MAG: signal peptidase I [Anaerolineaceae bacterium]|nr:signal peptidase I [Anaerolineaceae bacterium]
MKKRPIILTCLFPALCSFFLLFSFFLTTRKISKDDLDMIPTLSEKDLCLIVKGNDKVKKGRIVLVNHDGKENLLRVVGVGGDTVEIRNSEELFVNGELYVPERFIDYNPEHKFGTYTVDEGHVFVLGDNRSDAYDSGDYGQIPLSEVTGVVKLTFLAKEPDWSLYPLWGDNKHKNKNDSGISFDDFE